MTRDARRPPKMYDSIKRGHITLWCDQRVTESDTTGRKRKRESESTLREEKEEEVDRVYTELVKKVNTVYHCFGSGQEQLLLIIMMTTMTHLIGHNSSHKLHLLLRRSAKIHFLML